MEVIRKQKPVTPTDQSEADDNGMRLVTYVHRQRHMLVISASGVLLGEVKYV